MATLLVAKRSFSLTHTLLRACAFSLSPSLSLALFLFSLAPSLLGVRARPSALHSPLPRSFSLAHARACSLCSLSRSPSLAFWRSLPLFFVRFLSLSLSFSSALSLLSRALSLGRVCAPFHPPCPTPTVMLSRARTRILSLFSFALPLPRFLALTSAFFWSSPPVLPPPSHTTTIGTLVFCNKLQLIAIFWQHTAT